MRYKHILLLFVIFLLFSNCSKDNKPTSENQKVYKWNSFIHYLEDLQLNKNWQKYEDKGFKKCAVFDADGTIWNGDLTNTLINGLAAEKKLSDKALPHLNKLLIFFEKEPQKDVYAARDKLEEMFVSNEIFKAGENKGLSKLDVFSKVLGIWNYMLSDYSISELNNKTKKVFDNGFEDKVFVGAKEIIQYLNRNDFEVYVLSAGVYHIMAEGVKQAGLDIHADNVIGIKSEVIDGKLIDKIIPPILDKKGKTKVALSLCKGKPLIVFGDSVDSIDAGMLEKAQIPVAVEPKQKNAKVALEKEYFILDFETQKDGKPANTFVKD